MTAQDFSTMINNFDYYFDYSDSQKTYIKGMASLKEIKSAASGMTTGMLLEAKALITVEDALLDRYFKGMFPEVAPEPIQTPNSELFKTAWTIFKSGAAPSFSIALKKAWIIMRLKLRGNTVITFAKETGELRNALALSIGRLDTVARGFVRYIENIDGVEVWRSFKIDRLQVA